MTNKIYKAKDAIIKIDGQEVKGLNSIDIEELNNHESFKQSEYFKKFINEQVYTGEAKISSHINNWNGIATCCKDIRQDYSLCEYDWIEDDCDLYCYGILLCKITVGFKVGDPGTIYFLGVDEEL